jgi:hypothetical protein
MFPGGSSALALLKLVFHKSGDLMDASIVSALAALAGAGLGGVTYGLASWFTSRKQTRAEWLAQDRIRRQDLYKEFISAATRCYADALQHDEPDTPALVELYTTLGRMRVLSSPKVFKGAEQAAQRIVDTYLEPSKSFADLRTMVHGAASDLLRDFAEACRTEQDSLSKEQF